jgi:cardiolipin synthase A/B
MSSRLSVLRPGHRVQLLQGSSELFPALVAAMDAAVREVRLETYIFDVTGTGERVAQALERAARRGVSVKLVVDGFGSQAFLPALRERFALAGVECLVYAPLRRFGLLWPGSWRRLHRKLCVVDEEVAFCGGINILDDFHDPNHGALQAPRFDFAVEIRGPLVAEAGTAMKRLWLRMRALHDMKQARLGGALDSLRAYSVARHRPPSPVSEPSHTRAMLVLRDNLRSRAAIEQAYRRAIGHAREEIIIANAYFVPGGKMRRALVSAARRGVKVRLLLQGRYEYFMQYYAARPIYGALLRAGVEINEYSPSFLHAKVAVIDGHWATVGSSNLDPLSLLLAREANVVVEDVAFAVQLRDCLVKTIAQAGRVMNPDEYSHRPLRQRFMENVALGLMRLALMVQGKKYL